MKPFHQPTNESKINEISIDYYYEAYFQTVWNCFDATEEIDGPQAVYETRFHQSRTIRVTGSKYDDDFSVSDTF